MTGMLLRLAYGLQTGIALLSERDDAREDPVKRERGRDCSEASVEDELEDPVACAFKSAARDGAPLGERMDCGLLLAGLGSRASCWRDGMTTLLRRFISV